LTAAKELYDLGLIDEAEFKAAKAEILSHLSFSFSVEEGQGKCLKLTSTRSP
jgi:hypothetical protein